VRRQYGWVAALVVAAVAVIVFSTLPGSARNASRRAPRTTSTEPTYPNPWADTVQIDGIDGNNLSVHSIRHPELTPYVVEADQNTIFQRVAGSLFAPQPGLETGSQFYFTGVSATGGTPPPYVRALRIFPGA
jgi:hypothetical protein